MTSSHSPDKGDKEFRSGGYHSTGVPHEEGELRKPMRVLQIDNIQHTRPQSQPIKGGGTAESTSQGRLQSAGNSSPNDTAGTRGIFVLTRRDQNVIDTPVFHAGEADQKEALFVFSSESAIRQYISATDWQDSFEPANLTPTDLGLFLREAKRNNISSVIVNPVRRQHMQGEPQKCLDLFATPDLSGENLYREILDLA